MNTATSTHTDLHCSEGLCTACLPMGSEHFSPCFCACHLTVTEREPIIIDGCFVPFEIYDRVKAYARKTSKTQFIGVIHNMPNQPRAERTTFDWMRFCGVNDERARQMRAGENLVYVLDKHRDDLLLRPDLSMILWITPFGD